MLETLAFSGARARMKTPESLETLVEYGIIQEVVRPLMSGKEAQVFVVVSGGEECVAKVYKEATQRTFKHRVEYTEGRRTRNTRDQRAINKRTRHGKKQDEAAWRNAEVDTIYALRAAGVRVPDPINFVDGVLVMELVKNAEGDPAPRLGDLQFDEAQAYEIYQKLIRDVVRMLCAGVIHGDLSEFNVLMAAEGPVVIDFPQSVDPSKNQSARKLLLRDVENLHRFLARYCPNQVVRPYAQEMWSLYEKNRLAPDTELTGGYVAPAGETNMDEVLALIEDANQDELMRRDARGDDTPLVAPSPVRRVVDFTKEAKSAPRARNDQERTRPAGPRGSRNSRPTKPAAQASAADSKAASSADSKGAAPGGRNRKRRAGPRGPRSTEGEPAVRRARRGPSGPSGPSSGTGSSRSSNSSRASDPSHSPRSSEPSDEKRSQRAKPPASSEENQPKRRRRGRRRPASTGARGGVEENVSGPKSAPKRPASPASGASRSDQPVAKEGGDGAPRRRRRRRPRTPGSSSA
jgi:RIO kinase 1